MSLNISGREAHMKRVSATVLTIAALAGSAAALLPGAAQARSTTGATASCTVIPLGSTEITLCV
jgi:hypothetical protein